MKYVTLLLAAVVLAAQEKPAEQAKPAAEEKAAEAAPTQAKAAEEPLRGEFEIGVRFNSDLRGDLNTYRSIVNLGEGFRMLRWDTWLDTKKKWLKQAHFYGGGWGGDPTSWLRFSAEDDKWFRFTADHRTTAYFNAMPSFANPLLERGILTNQRSFDTRRRLTEVELSLMPGSTLIPYFGYTRDRGFGRGITNFVAEANEYPVLNDLNDETDMFRGGVRVQKRRFHLTLEQGGIRFNDGQKTEAAGAAQPGNRSTPLFGEQLVLRDLLQSYGISGSSIFSRGLATVQPAGWLDISAGFQFSQPRNDITYTHNATGRFVDLDSLLFFNGQNVRLLGAAKQPHLTANLGLEVRPEGRIRILQSWTTDRLHNAAAVTLTPFSGRLEWNYNQQQTEVLVEPVTRLTLRGGYRYVWGDGRARASFLGNAPFERGELRRHGALMGAGYRITDRFSLYSDVEIVRSNRVLFRTSLTDYEKARIRGRYALTGKLRMFGSVQYLNNGNPPDRNRFEFRSTQEAMGLEWMPGSGQGLQVLGEYARSALRSDLLYLAPQTLSSERSFYRENAHTITGMVSVPLALGWTWHARLSAGGSMFVSSGSRPTDFYQPVARITLPVWKRCSLLAEYRWYGVSQTFYRFEGFRSHQGIVGLRIQ
jgi:hypothetical protein